MFLCNFVDSAFHMSTLPLSHIFTVDEVFSIWTAFSFPLCLLLPSSATSKHNFMSISDTELTIHHQPSIQIESVITCTELHFSLAVRDTNGGFPFWAAKYCSCPFSHFPLLHTSLHKMEKKVEANITWTRLSRLRSHYTWFSAFSFSCEHLTISG